MSNITTLTSLKKEEEEATRKLIHKINKKTQEFINNNCAYTEDTIDVIEKIKNDTSDPNHEKINNLVKSRNDYLEYIDEMGLDPRSVGAIEQFAKAVIRQSSDNIIRSDVLEELGKSLDLTIEQRDYLMNMIAKQTGDSIQEINRKLNLGVDLNKYIDKPKDLKKLIETTYNRNRN